MLTIAQILGKDEYEKLCHQLKVADFPEAERAEVLAMLGENITARIMTELASKLSAEDVAHVQQLLDKHDAKKLFGFLQKRVPEFEGMMRTTANNEIETTVLSLMPA